MLKKIQTKKSRKPQQEQKNPEKESRLKTLIEALANNF